MVMIVTIDTREQTAYDFTRYGATTERGTLSTGDYSIKGFHDKVAVERKTIDDLVGCLMGKERERFERELSRGRALEFFAVVVEASMENIARGRYRSKWSRRRRCKASWHIMCDTEPVSFLPGIGPAANTLFTDCWKSTWPRSKSGLTWRGSATRLMGEPQRLCKR